MADIFISYAREDETRITELVRALEKHGWSIFWDRRIPAGKTWQSYIGQALSDAKCVIVAWSHHSITSDWVIEEANDAKERGCIVPVLLDSVRPPLGSRGIQAADLTDWKPGHSSLCFDQFIQDISEILGAKPPQPQILHPKPPPESPTQHTFTNSIGMEFVLIPAGSFTMGSRRSPKELVNRFGRKQMYYQYEQPPHVVKISRSFYLQTTEVSQGQWKKVMGNNPSYFKNCGDDCPVEQVSWANAQRFIEKLNQLKKTKAYRLPSEAEWEYACRAGSEAEFSFGNDAERLGEFAWFYDNSDEKTHPVGEKKPNAWGLYDMHGNVTEWVEDDMHGSNEGAPDDGSPWTNNPRGEGRVFRGGSCSHDARGCRSAARDAFWPDEGWLLNGFRLSRSVVLAH